MSTRDHIARLAYSPAEFSKGLGIGVATVRRKLKAGEISSTRLGRRILIPATEFLRITGTAQVTQFEARIVALKQAVADLRACSRAEHDEESPSTAAASARLTEQIDLLQADMAAYRQLAGVPSPQMRTVRAA
jgi:excisionase family DNA binding protein